MGKTVLNARDFATRGSATAGIQEAIDALPAGGGVVHLPPGRYPLRRSVQLKSKVTLRGDGPATVITRPRPIVTRLTRPADGSRKTFHVENTKGLKVGDEVYVGDDDSQGWWAAHCVIREMTETILRVRTLHGQRKHRFLLDRNARVTTWFPAFWLREVRGVTIEHLTIDGGVKRHRQKVCDFVVAAVHAHRAEEVRVANVTVRNWPGDGIGLQGGRGGIVTGCLVENCAGHGYHPGTSITESIWADNVARGNTRDGLFFCLRVTHSTVRGNVLVGNAGHGIGGLTDPDRYNAVVGNVCGENGRHGIDADRAIGNAIQGNVCRNNSQSAPGRYAGIYLAGHRDNCVTGNVCLDDQDRRTQRHAIVARDPAGENVITANHCVPPGP